ncbi:MAG TPA: GAF domain-containing protein, partial [Anaerolineae bacterium]|nr:GAF domain-containing protein [Anaerolineae bacterium]
GQWGVALETARPYRREQHRRREAETLYRAAQALTTTLDLREVLDRILTELQQVVPYDSASVQLLQEGRLEIIGGRGFPNLEELLGVTFDPEKEDNPNSDVVRSRAPVILEDAPTAYEKFRREPHAAAGIRAWMGVPLLFGDRLIGMLALNSREPGFYTPEHARLALAFAGQAAIAIENARIYRQLEEQSAKLGRALQELRYLDRLRDEVVQNVSHELRTPVTLIQGYAELLLSGDLGPVLETQRGALEVIRERTAMLSQLIYNLTALRVVPRETLALLPLAVQEPVRHALSSYSRTADRAGIRFEVDLPDDLPLVVGDRGHLRLVFSHLIENAIKFSPDGGLVRVRAWADGRWVCVAVQDRGIGIASEHLSRIFQRFYQVDGSTTRRFGGMGIGLALVWEIVDAHQGRVEVESKPGEGSTFTVVLPRAEEQR